MFDYFLFLPCSDQKVSGKCQAEMFDLRQQLMDLEIERHCHKGEEKGGKTIDCLMTLTEENEGRDDVIRADCVEAVSQ